MMECNQNSQQESPVGPLTEKVICHSLSPASSEQGALASEQHPVSLMLVLVRLPASVGRKDMHSCETVHPEGTALNQ